MMVGIIKRINHSLFCREKIFIIDLEEDVMKRGKCGALLERLMAWEPEILHFYFDIRLMPDT